MKTYLKSLKERHSSEEKDMGITDIESKVVDWM
jgi:hypothetical protein